MYYPKSQVKTNLYTNGNELVYINKQDTYYIGYYYELSTGKKFTGRTPNSKGTVELTNFTSLSDIEDNTLPVETVLFAIGEDADPDKTLSQDLSEINYELIVNYHDLTSKNIPSRFIPQTSVLNPTTEEVRIGECQRYFAKKNSNYLYFETNKESYEKFINNDPTFASDLYTIISLPWRLISGLTNKKIAAKAEKDNKWYGFTEYITSFLNTTPSYLYTEGGEYLLPNRTSYIGYYHLMVSKFTNPSSQIAMTGKYHGEGGDITLISLNTTQPLRTTKGGSTSSPSTVSSPSSTSTTGGGGGGY